MTNNQTPHDLLFTMLDEDITSLDHLSLGLSLFLKDLPGSH